MSIPKGKPGVEYHGRISFHPNGRDQPIRGQVTVSVPKHYAISFINGLFAKRTLTYFDMSLRTVPNTDGRYQWFTFKARLRKTDENRTLIMGGEGLAALKVLLDYIAGTDIKIVWKEGAFGYEIDSTGVIKEKWELDPF